VVAWWGGKKKTKKQNGPKNFFQNFNKT